MPPKDAVHLQLAELLDFRPELGTIRLHDQRVVILSAAAMGLMKKELIDTLGRSVARRVMLRFGYADGYHDAVTLRARSRWETPLDGLRSGATLHTLAGLVRAEVRRLEYDEQSGRFEEDVVWHNSYEAEQHQHYYGQGAPPVCWSLVGYSSGFVSACVGGEVYFREVECAGQGKTKCRAIGRDVESQVLARAVHAHIHHRVFMNGNKTIVFPASPGSYASERMG